MNRQHFKSKLLAEKTALEKELGTVGRRDPVNPKDWEPVSSERESAPPDRDEAAEKIESFEENAAIVRQLEARFDEVQAALLRIGSGAYGRCAACNKEIEVERLNANPAAMTCKAHLK